MKKLTLTQLSQSNLDKMQRKATLGGVGRCVCCWICGRYCVCTNVRGEQLVFSIEESTQITQDTAIADFAA